ncbi:coniferyl alcohol acyltransferase-like [Beta vulgaris subsp. vulgaris]|uniref:coniferyl alcohol acyltransferase-like n=1 Tax=Beta vulgaris subsp. vulgaris TaxID=3555 RepID=UPI002036F062|nr:coniferyl alcohol acyltransferase-like [Beta vulgaris subsp. vulgaris]
MVATKEFQVRVKKRERVVPMHPIVQHNLPLSNLDLLLPPKDVGVFLCYKRPSYSYRFWSFELMVSTLKTALAQALVHFYVFSGDVVRNSKGEAEILCNNQGVEFVEAYANIELCELNLHNPDESVEGKLLLPKQSRVLSVQATELKCGGIVVGCTFDHRIADAYSGNMFLVSWAELANSKPLTMMPSFTKSFLNPRLPSSYDPSLNDMYIPISTLLPPRENNNETPPCRNDPLLSRIYHVNAKEISHLQSQTNGTKLESFSAFMWKLISKHASISQNEPKVASSITCKMGIVVDGRTRLVINKGDNNSMHKKEIIGCYFGNVLSVPFGEKKLSDLIEKPLNLIAQDVHEFLRKVKSDEHFRDLIDWVEVHRPKLCLAKIYSNGRDDGPAFVVSSGQRFPVSKVDFGWGKPIFGSYHFPWGGNAGYVMPMPSSKGNGDWIVYMHLTQGQLEFIEKEASHVFKRFKLF